jgi:hypothetical protein
MAGFKVWTTGDLVNASDFNSYLQEQVIMRFANATARDSAVSSAEEGMFCFLQDSNTLQFYDGSSWTSFIGEGDITSIVTASTSGLSGGTTSGVATLSITPAQATSGTVASTDIILFGDADDSNNLKKTTVADINNLVSAGVSLGLVLALS